ncbi:hypothetical protein M408DRAFT_30405 [Serendipita vermifera MAFF 305830]|uniref:Uncharacterized protein n=1 Tax=Serendipita vermifera MAFF 305830 TaxID=933852 RepID=A0A0C3AK08_SERVB|nr:hypothetical protein M408DRAFT_30405 [Serendipita vermifera MAFF 305830]
MIGFKKISIFAILFGSVLLSNALPTPEVHAALEARDEHYPTLVARGSKLSIRACYDCPSHIHDKILKKVEKEYGKDKQLAKKGYNVCDIHWKSGLIAASYSINGSFSQRVTITYRPSNFKKRNEHYSELVARGPKLSIRACYDCPSHIHDKILKKVEKEYAKDKQLAKKGYNVCDIHWKSGIIAASYSINGSFSERVTIAYRPSNFKKRDEHYSQLVARGPKLSIRACYDCPSHIHDKILKKVEKEYAKDKQLAKKGYNVCDIHWKSGLIAASYSINGSFSERVTIAYRPSNF